METKNNNQPKKKGLSNKSLFPKGTILEWDGDIAVVIKNKNGMTYFMWFVLNPTTDMLPKSMPAYEIKNYIDAGHMKMRWRP